MILIRISGREIIVLDGSTAGYSLLDILRTNGYDIYAPCGGRGTCGKCRVEIKGEGEVIACKYYPYKDIEVILPGEKEANILVHQTKYLEDLPFQISYSGYITSRPYGVAIDIGTTTVVLYFLNLLSGHIEEISSFLNPQRLFGADVITRINYCQENTDGLIRLQKSIVDALNGELEVFRKKRQLVPGNFEKIVVAGNTTMLHMLLGEDPVSIALAPFKPRFTEKQIRKGHSTGLNINADAVLITLPSVSAFVGADITAGLAALNVSFRNYLFLDLGTNGEMALIKGEHIIACATAAGPAFEGANISCGTGAVTGAISGFTGQNEYHVIGNTLPRGICGSGIIDIVAYLLHNELIDEAGFLKNTFIVNTEKNIYVNQQDIREIQLAKSAVYSGIKIMLNMAELSFNDMDALFLAGGFGNYINVGSAIQIGLLPLEMKEKTYAIGNSAGIGALEYLKNSSFEDKVCRILKNTRYIELSDSDEFPTEFALNMNFVKNN
jgi:uncharacterized 2Fe-2S/4Fe-4S cluster protein (DUF4445 family)